MSFLEGGVGLIQLGELAAAASFFTSLMVLSRFLILESNEATVPAIPAAALPPVTLVKKRMKAAEIVELYFIPLAVNLSMTIWTCKDNQIHRTIYSTCEPWTLKSMRLRQIA